MLKYYIFPIRWPLRMSISKSILCLGYKIISSILQVLATCRGLTSGFSSFCSSKQRANENGAKHRKAKLTIYLHHRRGIAPHLGLSLLWLLLSDSFVVPLQVVREIRFELTYWPPLDWFFRQWRLQLMLWTMSFDKHISLASYSS